MTHLEAHLCAEVVAAQLLDEHPDADKLSFLRERTVEITAFIDEQLEVLEQAA